MVILLQLISAPSGRVTMDTVVSTATTSATLERLRLRLRCGRMTDSRNSSKCGARRRRLLCGEKGARQSLSYLHCFFFFPAVLFHYALFICPAHRGRLTHRSPRGNSSPFLSLSRSFPFRRTFFLSAAGRPAAEADVRSFSVGYNGADAVFTGVESASLGRLCSQRRCERTAA